MSLTPTQPISTSSQAFIIDLLVQKFQALGLSIPVGTASEPVPVYDGPQGPDNPDNYVVVMGWPSADESDSTLKWSYLGTYGRYEDYDIAVMVFSYVGGDDNNATFDASDAQLTARTNAAYIEAAIEASLLIDPNLSTQNNGVPACIWLLLQSTRYDQTPPEEESEMGRFAQYALRVHVKNLLAGIPS